MYSSPKNESYFIICWIFLYLLRFGYMDFQCTENILICVLKINQSLMGLEPHEDE